MAQMTQLETERQLRNGQRTAAADGGLPALIDALRWRWKPVLLIAALFTLGATIYVESLPSQYDGETILSIAPRAGAERSDANIVRVVGPKYVEFATAPATIDEVADSIGEDPETIEDATDATIATDTGNVMITVRLPSAMRAARAANAIAAEVVRFSRRDPLLVATVVARALPPSEPSAPPRRLLEAAALLIGLLQGIGVTLLLERGRPRLRSWRDLARLTGYPVVGRIPPSRVLRTRPTKAFSDPRTASAFRILRANLEPQVREGDVDVLLVTSPQAAEGKTTVAALLAESLGRLGFRVLLIDADLRRPGVGRLASVSGADGLSSVLRSGGDLNGAVRPGWADGLWLLPTHPDPEAGDLLPRRFGEVVAEARRAFDVVVIDAPPLLGTDDARTLARIARGILLVVSAGSTPANVNEAILAVEALNAPLIGVVGNRFKEAEQPYYY
jgi:capsular exopolysaccharide synthesis family protein